MGSQAVSEMLREVSTGPAASPSAFLQQGPSNDAPPYPVQSPEITRLLKEGEPLPPDVQRELASEFGQDFSNLRVHEDAAADHLSKSLEADAFAVGNQIVFRRDRYRPDTAAGRRLIAHEAGHIAAGQTRETAGPSPVQLSVSLDDISDEMIGKSFTLQSDQGAAPNFIPRGSVVVVVDWLKRAASARVEFNDAAQGRTNTLNVPKLALELIHPPVKGIRRYDVGLPSQQTAVGAAQGSVARQTTTVADWRKKESSYKKNHDVWAASLQELETELTRRQDVLLKKEAVLSGMLVRKTMLNHFDPAIAK